MSTTRVYIVRHCEAEGNTLRYFQGHTDGAVSPNGYVQCGRLAERFQGIHLDAVYSSPLKRAVFTAEAVNRYHGLPIVTDAGLMEIHGGHWEGKRWADLPGLFPEEARVWAECPMDFAPVGGESMRQVFDRIYNAVTGIAARHPGQSVAVVSHGCAIRNLVTRLKHNDITYLRDADWHDNTSVTLAEWGVDGTARIVFEGDIGHLDANTTTLGKQRWWRQKEAHNFFE